MTMICVPNKLSCKSSTRQAHQEPFGDTHTGRTILTKVRRGCFSDSVELCCDWPTASSNGRLKCQGVSSKCLRSGPMRESRFSGPTEVSHLWAPKETRGQHPACMNLPPPRFASSSLLLSSPSLHVCVMGAVCLLVARLPV